MHGWTVVGSQGKWTRQVPKSLETSIVRVDRRKQIQEFEKSNFKRFSRGRVESLLHMSKLFHKMFPCFHYFHVFFLNRAGFSSILPRKFVDIATNRFFNLVKIFVAIAMKFHRYCHEILSLLPRKFCLSHWLVLTASWLVDLYIPDFKRLCDTIAIVATLFVAFFWAVYFFRHPLVEEIQFSIYIARILNL